MAKDKLPKKRDMAKRKKLLARNSNEKYYDWAFHHLNTIKEWASKGVTLAQMARYMKISMSTLYRWMDNYIELKLAIREGRDMVCHKVEEALVKKALGYDLPHIETTTITDADGNVVQKVQKQNVKHLAPDMKAIEFFLKNRDSENWSKSSDGPDISGGVLLVPMTKEDSWAEMAKQQQAKLQKDAEQKATEAVNGAKNTE